MSAAEPSVITVPYAVKPFWEFDWDDFFAYQTPKTVIIKNRALGLVRLASTTAIALYIFVYVIIVKEGYLDVDTPTGSVVSTLKSGSLQGSFNLPYCPDANGLKPHWPYPEEDTFQCQVLDAIDVSHNTGSITIK